MTDLIGRTLGQYRIVEQIGEGGMATVYKAYQPGLNREVAIKVLPPIHAKQPGFSERFQREAEAIANLNHPNILPVFDSGQENKYSYIVMRYVENARTLREVMESPLPVNRAADIIGQIAGALDYAHQRGIIHRDVKPSNVLMDGDWALLTDFGLAKMTESSVRLTGTGVGIGTPAYMSPEQGEGRVVDHRTDIYALGTILFEMMTGRLPYDAETPVAIVFKRANETLPLPHDLNPKIPEAVERVILKALARQPEYRFASAGEMAAALKTTVSETHVAQAQETLVRPPPPTPPPPARKSAFGWPWLAGLGAIAIVIVLCLIGSGIGWLNWSGFNAASTTPEAAMLPAMDTATATPTTLSSAPTKAPTLTATSEPTPTDTPKPTPTNTPVPPTATPTPSPKPTRTPTRTATTKPTHTPTPASSVKFCQDDYIVREDDWLSKVADKYYGDVLAYTAIYEATNAAAKVDDRYATLSNPDIIPEIGSLLCIPSYEDAQRIMNGEFTFNNTTTAQESVSPTNTPLPSTSTRPSYSGRIAFASERDGNSEIYVMNANGSGQTNLTNNPGWDHFPAWSPDGSRIAFESGRDGDANNVEIYVMNADGSGQTNLTNDPASDAFPSWSPDGKYIVFMRNADIYIMNADGSRLKNLTGTPGSEYNPHWSPDGSKIVFESAGVGNTEIYLMNIDGSQITRLTDYPNLDWNPAWSPDGTHIAFESDRDGNNEIYLMNADGTGVIRLTNNPATDNHPTWSPDGSHIAFVSFRDGNSEIYVMNIDGSGLMNLTNNPASDNAPAWGP
ncbi:MAG: PD40 domain-containing protein [Anaerolineae bacterium]|nr:PD40 domain-containing protein [Anaerolineae bacterium]